MIIIQKGVIKYFVKQEDNTFKEVYDREEYNLLQEPLRRKWEAEKNDNNRER